MNNVKLPSCLVGHLPGAVIVLKHTSVGRAVVCHRGISFALSRHRLVALVALSYSLGELASMFLILRSYLELLLLEIFL